MTAYILHFSCTPSRDVEGSERWTADVCAITPSVEEAEALARQLIASRSYIATALISYAKVAEDKLAALSPLEGTLYLKALKSHDAVAVLFSQWHDER